METTKQPIEAAGLLSKIGEMFFKGLGGLMNSAAEYEEDFGVLKQVTRIPLVDKGDGKKLGTLTIKLAPIKNKDGKYYVEAETDVPNFDVSSINGKTMDLDKNNMASFEKVIDKLIADNNLAPDNKDAEKPEGEQASEEGEGEELSESEKAEVAETAEELNKSIGSKKFQCMGEEGEVAVVAEYELDDETSEMIIRIHVEDADGNVLSDYPEDEQSYSAVGEDGKVISIAQFRNITKDQFKAYLANNNLESLEEGTFASSSVKATFIKSSETNDVELTAITASCDLSDAMDIIYVVADDDDFTSSLSDDPQSFEIVECEDGYDVNPIAEIDTSDTYNKLFQCACNKRQLLQTVEWMIGCEEFYKSAILNTLLYTLSELSNVAAKWLIEKTYLYPIPCIDFDQQTLTDGLGDATLGNIESYVAEQCYECYTMLDVLYVNLDHVEQSEADPILSAFRANLAHAGYKFD